MADSDGIRVVLNAIFKQSGLDKLGRDFSSVSERMKRMQAGMQGVGKGMPDFRKMFNAEQLGASEVKLQRAAKLYDNLLLAIRKTSDPTERSRLEGHLARVVRIGRDEQDNQERLNRGAAEANNKLLTAQNLRRGLRLGLGALGLPMSIGAAGRQMGEAMEQENIISPMALRVREVSGPITDFSEHVMDLRRNIVAAGAEFAFSGRESLAMADNLSKMSGGMVDMRTVFEAARGLGVAPQAAGQVLAMTRRLGGIGFGRQGEDGFKPTAQSPMADERTANMLAKAISSSGMMPRSEEFIQTLVQTMQTYSTRTPSVSPNTLMSILSALSAEGTAGAPGVGRFAPTLRGAGGMQVVQGMTAMMDDMSEAMVAIQSEIVGKAPQEYAATAKQLGISTQGPVTGGDRYALLMALKQAGVSDPDGLRLAGRTIKEITKSFKDDTGTRLGIEATLLRVSPQIAAALEKGGFMKKLEENKLSADQLSTAVDSLRISAGTAQLTYGMAAKTVGRELAGATVTLAEEAWTKITPKPETQIGMAEMIHETMYGPDRGGKKEEEAAKKRRGEMITAGGVATAGAVAAYAVSLLSGVGAIGTALVAAPMIYEGLEERRKGKKEFWRPTEEWAGKEFGELKGWAGKEVAGAEKWMGQEVRELKVTVKVEFGSVGSAIAAGITAAAALEKSMMDEVKKLGRQYVFPNSDPHR